MQTSLIDMPKGERLEDQVILKYSWEEETDIGSLDVEYYGRSLLGFGKIYKKISRIFLETEIEVNIDAEKEGSIETIINFFSTQEITACANALQFLGFLGLDYKQLRKLPALILNFIIEIIIRTKGKKGEIKEAITKLNIADEIREKLIRLFENIDFRTHLDEMTAFLSQKWMKSLTIEQTSCPKSVILRKDRPSFVAQPEDEVTVELSEKLVSVTYLSPEKSKWQFKSRNFEFWAIITDASFLENMHGKVLEDITDMKFVATVKKTTTKEANTKKTKTEREIYSFTPEQRQASLLK